MEQTNASQHMNIDPVGNGYRRKSHPLGEAGSMETRSPKTMCWMMGNLQSTSALYMRMRPGKQRAKTFQRVDKPEAVTLHDKSRV